MTRVFASGLLCMGLVAGQNVGIGTAIPASRLSVAGNVSIGATYSASTAPPNGLIVEG